MERPQVEAILPEGFSLLNFATCGHYVLATVSFPDNEGDGSWLAFRDGDHWEELALTGGVLWTEDLEDLDVPQEHWPELLSAYR